MPNTNVTIGMTRSHNRNELIATKTVSGHMGETES